MLFQRLFHPDKNEPLRGENVVFRIPGMKTIKFKDLELKFGMKHYTSPGSAPQKVTDIAKPVSAELYVV